MAEKIILTHGTAPGDITCLTALPRDLALTYPGKYEVHVSTTCRELWRGNPHIADIHGDHWPSDLRRIPLDYGKYMPLMNTQKIHFITAFHHNFRDLEKLEVPVLFPKGDLYLPERKMKERPVSDKYWIVLAGGKLDFTAKVWSAARWQQVVDKLVANGLTVAQCGSRAIGHKHPTLSNVLDLLGKTDFEDFLWWIKHADGVICPITFAMHAAAAFERPCVVVAGGREHWWWEAYINQEGATQFGTFCQPVAVPHRYLHTQDLLDCCKGRGCWRNKIHAKPPMGSDKYCSRPTNDGYGQVIPGCLDMITADHVVEAAMSYYKDGTLAENKQNPSKTAEFTSLRALPATELDLFAPKDEIFKPKIASLQELPPLKMVEAFRKAKSAKQKVQIADTLDNNVIGGGLTICVSLGGDSFEAHQQLLGSILASIAFQRRQLRVACNSVCAKTLDFVLKLQDAGHVNALINNTAAKNQYEQLAQLVNVPNEPIEYRWVVWFAENAMIADTDWCRKLCSKLIEDYPKGYSLFGATKSRVLTYAQLAWARTRPWYRKERETERIDYVSGGFWALNVAAMREASIPDPLVAENGGEIMFSNQLLHAGYKIGRWNSGNKYILT